MLEKIQFKKLIKILFFLSYIVLINSKLLAEDNNVETKQLNVRDIDFDNLADENNIFIYLKIQEEYAVTLKQFNFAFNVFLKKSGLQQKIDKGQIPSNALIELKRNFLIQFIDNELFYQEGLKDPEIKIFQNEIDKAVSKRMLFISQNMGMTFEQFIEKENLTYAEFTKNTKKELYVKKVLAEQTKFTEFCTPQEVEEQYKRFAKEGRFSKKFREVYIAELPIGELEKIENAETIISLEDFQNFARQISIHHSRKLGGKIEDVPFVRNFEFKNNENLISNLFFETIWSTPLSKCIEVKKNDRKFYLWVNKEFEKQTQMTQEVQAFIFRQLNSQKKVEMEQNFTLKIATSASFKIRYKNQLIATDLRKFLKESLEIIYNE